MPQWKYCIYTVTGTTTTRITRTIDYCDGNEPKEFEASSYTDVLRDFSQKGWELVSVVNFSPVESAIRFFFKR